MLLPRVTRTCGLRLRQTTHCHFPSTTLLVEGMNNKIKFVERIGHVYRDDGHFPLEIRATFPGILG